MALVARLDHDLTSPRAGAAAAERRAFEVRLRAEAAALPPEARAALDRMLGRLSEFAETRATASGRTHKYLMLAYWKVIAIYVRHFRRLVRSAG